jgi:hypothetical protein
MLRNELVASAARHPHLMEQYSNCIQKQFSGFQVTSDVLFFLARIVFVFCVRCHYLCMSVLMNRHQPLMSVNSGRRSSDVFSHMALAMPTALCNYLD